MRSQVRAGLAVLLVAAACCIGARAEQASSGPAASAPTQSAPAGPRKSRLILASMPVLPMPNVRYDQLKPFWPAFQHADLNSRPGFNGLALPFRYRAAQTPPAHFRHIPLPAKAYGVSAPPALSVRSCDVRGASATRQVALDARTEGSRTLALSR